jgi:hypothetical protein
MPASKKRKISSRDRMDRYEGRPRRHYGHKVVKACRAQVNALPVSEARQPGVRK